MSFERRRAEADSISGSSVAGTEAISEQAASAEIERYMAIPAQALSYKIGQLKILELRKKASDALGDQFNLAFFHDEVLKYGCLPLDVLESIINEWIEKQRA